ncbi:hypothetical protein VNO77_32862 [Canavalia gladiata]|uniref:Uncharacterized protein n=1 Tax=Canavalia gladiata TaxID=3824 RepID=A0AAN9PXU9_CANGL
MFIPTIMKIPYSSRNNLEEAFLSFPSNMSFLLKTMINVPSLRQLCSLKLLLAEYDAKFAQLLSLDYVQTSVSSTIYSDTFPCVDVYKIAMETGKQVFQLGRNCYFRAIDSQLLSLIKTAK